MLQNNYNIKNIFYNTRHLIPLFIGLALFSQTYIHATGRWWREVVQRFNYACEPQTKLLSSISVNMGMLFKFLAGLLGKKYGTLTIFLSSCWLSLLTLPLLYRLSYLNYFPVLGMLFAAVPASIFQCLLYKYKLEIAHNLHIKDISICWNAVSSIVNILSSSIPSLICFHPQGGIHVFILYSSLVSIFIIYSHYKLHKDLIK